MSSPPSKYPDGNPKTQFGLQKPQLSLIPSSALIELAAAMALGASKYQAYNWRTDGVSASVYLDAAERHLRYFLDGEDLDPESGASHLGHVMACCAILIDAKAVGKLNDNRPTPGKFAELVREFAEARKAQPIPCDGSCDAEKSPCPNIATALDSDRGERSLPPSVTYDNVWNEWRRFVANTSATRRYDPDGL